MLARLRSIVRGVTRRSDVERDMAEELRFHVEARAADHIAAGLSPDDATRRARVEFGGIESYKEQCRDARGLRLIDELRADLKYGSRVLRRSPTFAAVAVVSLALGIGANTAMFHLLDVLRLKALPVPNPSEIAEVRVAGSHGGMGITNGFNGELTNPLWEQIRDHQEGFSGVFAWGDGFLRLGDGPDARDVRALWVSGQFFPTLGLHASRGRLLEGADDQRGCGRPAAVISYALWQHDFGGLDAAIGRDVTIQDRRFEIVGVAPAAFTGLEVGRAFDVALPLCANALWSPVLDSRHIWWLRVMGRLNPGVTAAAAAARFKAISPALFDATVPAGYGAESIDKYRALRLEVAPASTGVSAVREEYNNWLWLLLAMTGAVLLIVCANLANLMVARASARDREFAVRIALGASRRRVIRQLLCESSLLAMSAAALSLGVARVFTRTLVWLLSTEGDPLHLDLAMDWRVFAATLAVGTFTCVVFGLTAAWRSSLATPGVAMNAAGRGFTTGRERFSLQRLLVVSQIALSLLLVAGALTFVRSFRNLVTLDPGFRPKGLVIVLADLSRLHLPAERRQPAARELLERIQSIPAVQHAATTSNIPLQGSSWTMGVTVGGSSEQKGSSKITWISDDYFKTMGIPLVAGREFNAADAAGSPPVAVVNQTFVSRFVGASDPIGRTVETKPEPGYPAAVYQIVGVVKDTKYSSLRQAVQPIAFVPASQHPSPRESVAMLVRSAETSASLTAAIRTAARDFNPNTVVSLYLFESTVNESLAGDRAMAALAGFFGQLAAGVAAIGLYGLISFIVARRRNEIGVRIALGATRASVIALVMKETGVLIGLGIAIGVPAMLIGGRLMAADLFGVTPADPLTIVSAALVMIAVAVAAGLIPAYRAAKIDPMQALRCD